VVIVLMGVTGTGKTTVGKALAGRLGWPFHDADDYHPEANKEKMRLGFPLGDEDREPWLRTLAELIDGACDRGEGLVLACSALKQTYRDYLQCDAGSVRYVHLTGSRELIERRLEARAGHFMDPDLLSSQLETLEIPEGAITIDITPSPEEIAAEIERELGLRPR
jgi:gluconokinase